MIEISRQKTHGTGFNATDEDKLRKFLEAVEGERHFHRHLRDIADQLLNEL